MRGVRPPQKLFYFNIECIKKYAQTNRCSLSAISYEPYKITCRESSKIRLFNTIQTKL